MRKKIKTFFFEWRFDIEPIKWSLKSFNVNIEDDSEFEYIKKEIVEPKKGISGYTTDVSRTKEGGLMIHTKIVYQDLDIEALNKANDEKKTFGELANYSEHIKNFKKEGYKRIK